MLDIEFDNDKYEIRDQLMSFLGYELGQYNCMLIFIGVVVAFRILAFICFKCLLKKV